MNLIMSGCEGLRPLADDITGKVVVVAHTRLKRRYQLPRFQLIHATGGFGCKTGNLGSKVFGRFVCDGEDATYNRSDFIGMADEALVSRAMADPTPVGEIDKDQRVYMLIARSGHWETGDTVNQAMKRLRRLTKSAIAHAYHLHPESFINDMGYISYPEGITPQEIQVKKEGNEWIATT